MVGVSNCDKGSYSSCQAYGKVGGEKKNKFNKVNLDNLYLLCTIQTENEYEGRAEAAF
jgi:hypothetical protein